MLKINQLLVTVALVYGSQQVDCQLDESHSCKATVIIHQTAPVSSQMCQF